MNLTTLRAGPGFWDRFAPCYEKWLRRCIYHKPMVNDLLRMAERGWRVLDVGAATGVLSFPLASCGCTVVALEPSPGMRRIFSEKINAAKIEGIEIIPNRWEDYMLGGDRFDLVVACNSLHLTDGGISQGMRKVFSAQATYLCLITEINQDFFIDFKHIDMLQDTYTFLSIKNYRVDSSYYFDTMDEVLDLEDVLDRPVKTVIMNDLPVQRDAVDVAVVWWERKQAEAG